MEVKEMTGYVIIAGLLAVCIVVQRITEVVIIYKLLDKRKEDETKGCKKISNYMEETSKRKES
jgi:hypothetical protein